MNDLISRQMAIDMCRKPRMRNADCSDFEMEIMMLPPAQPKNDYKKALDCILTAYLNPEIRHDILAKFVFETFSVGEIRDVSKKWRNDDE